jgi:hypothetical protein
MTEQGPSVLIFDCQMGDAACQPAGCKPLRLIQQNTPFCLPIHGRLLVYKPMPTECATDPAPTKEFAFALGAKPSLPPTNLSWNTQRNSK